MKKTKIIATIGPSTDSEVSIKKLYESGVNIIRFNFSHANYENAKLVKSRIDKLNKSRETCLSALLDTKGPEIRTGDLETKIQFEKGNIFKIFVDKAKYTEDGKSLFCDYEYLVEDLNIGDIIEIDSGLMKALVKAKNKDYLEVEALSPCLIGSRRHINLPGKRIRLPGITQKDKEDVFFAIENKYDFIAQSFVRSKVNVLELRELLDSNNAFHIKIIAKIENEEGVENLDEIIEVADGIMVARGDLGIEVPIESLPIFQRQMVSKCLKTGKFVIIATHLLETMIESPFPTRAEVSDVFNSVMQKADCLMLSGETAMGKYPIECVEMMTKVIVAAENQIHYKHHDFENNGLTPRDIEKKLLIKSSVFMADELDVDAILIFTRSGRLARLAASYRPKKPVYSFSGDFHSVQHMNILFGVEPFLLNSWSESSKENVTSSISLLLEKGKLTRESKVIVITDIQKDGKEIPAIEIITIRDFF
ncbi:MAG: pyruvate kinase [Candidatus Gracilibacteria bacterium]|nr:pyruvate kinase [Candidatus Gracilibacteria bacterium]MDD2909017.1 pyruvate kinase [Candidatus Gracilibacteria bacterium]